MYPIAAPSLVITVKFPYLPQYISIRLDYLAVNLPVPRTNARPNPDFAVQAFATRTFRSRFKKPPDKNARPNADTGIGISDTFAFQSKTWSKEV
jgi:hypothetical protein